ncbi:MAG: hypothetical protein M3094_08660, partial [Actinomycetia bacterium]|nr:hypothetical protein [Actinomycetes bacterium]
MADFSYPVHKIGAAARGSRGPRPVKLKIVNRAGSSRAPSTRDSSDIITAEAVTGGVDPETGEADYGTMQRNQRTAERLLENPDLPEEDRDFVENVAGMAGGLLGGIVGGTLGAADKVEEWIPGKQMKPSSAMMTIMEGLGRAGTTVNMVYQDTVMNFAKPIPNMVEMLNVATEGFSEESIQDYLTWVGQTGLEASSGEDTDLGAADYLDIMTGHRARLEEKLGLSDLGAGTVRAEGSQIDRDDPFWSNPVMSNLLSAEHLFTGVSTDVALDPLSYVTGGTAGMGAPVAMKMAQGAIERSTLKAVREVAKIGVKQMARELAETSASKVKFADDAIARRLSQELVVKIPRAIADDSLKAVTSTETALEHLVGLRRTMNIGTGPGLEVVELPMSKWRIGAAAAEPGVPVTTNMYETLVQEVVSEIKNKSFGRYVDDGSWWKTFEVAVEQHADTAMKPWMLGGLRIGSPVISPRMANTAIRLPGSQGMKRAITSRIKKVTGTTRTSRRADDWVRSVANRSFNKSQAELSEAARFAAGSPKGSYAKVVSARADAEWVGQALQLSKMVDDITGMTNKVKNQLTSSFSKKDGIKLFDQYLDGMARGDLNALKGQVDDQLFEVMERTLAKQKEIYANLQAEYFKWDPKLAQTVGHANYQPLIKTRQANKWMHTFVKDYADQVPELTNVDDYARFAMEVQSATGQTVTVKDVWMFRELIAQEGGVVARMAPIATPGSQKFRKLGRNFIAIASEGDELGAVRVKPQLRDVADMDRAMTAIVDHLTKTRDIPLKWKTGTQRLNAGIKRHEFNIRGFFETDPTTQTTAYIADISNAIHQRALATAGFKYGFIIRNGKFVKPDLVSELMMSNTAHTGLDAYFLKRAELLTAEELEILLAKASSVTQVVGGHKFQIPVDLVTPHMSQMLDDLDIIFKNLKDQGNDLSKRYDHAVIKIKQANPDFSIDQSRSAALRTLMPSLQEAQETFLIGAAEELGNFASGLTDWFAATGAGQLEANLRAKVAARGRATKLFDEYQKLEAQMLREIVGHDKVVYGRAVTPDELELLSKEVANVTAAKLKAAKAEAKNLADQARAQVDSLDPNAAEAVRLRAAADVGNEAARIIEDGPRQAVPVRRIMVSGEQYAPPGVAERLGEAVHLWDPSNAAEGSAYNMVKQSDATVLFWHPSWQSGYPGRTKMDLNRFVEWIVTGENPKKAITGYNDTWDFFEKYFVPIGNGAYITRPGTKNKIVILGSYQTTDGVPDALSAVQRALDGDETISVLGWDSVLDTGGAP